MIAEKLKPGDEIRVISPSSSLQIISHENRKIATDRLSKMGFRVTFSKHAEECDSFFSSSIESRVDDLHTAFGDPAVKAILTTIGGYNSNQLLRYLDYSLIAKNPKIFCGFSDITALQHAIWTKTGLITYSGPHYSTVGCLKGIDYVMEYFKKCVCENAPFFIASSSGWSDDAWYVDQENRQFFPNEGCHVIQEGEASGTILGANLATLNLLQGTEYMPSLNGSVLFLEDDALSKAVLFDRDLQSLLHQVDFNGVAAVVIGRFERKSGISLDQLRDIIASKNELKSIPVVANADFGHTLPFFTFPIGGKASLVAKEANVQIHITKH
jgi:muramoyltetrapeptide carboxypeptidase LdcA involved in peptidoglycan recycling